MIITVNERWSNGVNPHIERIIFKDGSKIRLGFVGCRTIFALHVGFRGRLSIFKWAQLVQSGQGEEYGAYLKVNSFPTDNNI